MGEARADQPLFQLREAEGNQGINVAFSGDGLIKDQGEEAEYGAQNESPQIEKCRYNQQKDAHEFQSIAQLIAGLGIVGHRDKGHVQHGFAVEPAGFHRILSQHNACDHTQRSGQHAGRVDCSQPQSVNGKFQNEQLKNQRYMNLVGQPDKFQPAGNPVWVLHKQKPHRSQKQGEK